MYGLPNQAIALARLKTFTIPVAWIFMAAAIGFALPESLRAAPDSVQPGSRLVAGAGGHEGDASHFQYLELVGRGDAFRYRVAAETRRAPTRIPRGSAGFGNERTLKG